LTYKRAASYPGGDDLNVFEPFIITLNVEHMRQVQQNNRNNRQRGRGRRNSGGGNPANKVYDSNGPDVRVRGSAQTVADKYLQLAGDAQSQGDSVTAESYFQHAEHYLRIVAAAQAARAQKQAEKEKAAEEHAARMKAKRERENPPVVAAPDNEKPSGESPETAEAKSDDDSWEGPKPAFLKSDDGDAETPKKPRRRNSSKKAKTNGKEKTDTDKDDGAIPVVADTETEEATSAS
jgi:hypothetical protein